MAKIENEAKTAIQQLFETDPIKLLQFMLLCAGRDMRKANAAEMTFSCEMDVDDKRFDVKAVITLNPVADSSTETT